VNKRIFFFDQMARCLLRTCPYIARERREMDFKYDFDTTPYFNTAASTLIRDHGDEALMLADHAIQKMRRTGDKEGTFMWEGVRSAIFDRIIDTLNDGISLHRDDMDGSTYAERSTSGTITH